MEDEREIKKMKMKLPKLQDKTAMHIEDTEEDTHQYMELITTHTPQSRILYCHSKNKSARATTRRDQLPSPLQRACTPRALSHGLLLFFFLFLLFLSSYHFLSVLSCSILSFLHRFLPLFPPYFPPCLLSCFPPCFPLFIAFFLLLLLLALLLAFLFLILRLLLL